MKLICHIYDRAEGKTTEALKEAQEDGAVLILGHQSLMDEVKRDYPQIKIVKGFLGLKGLHPKKIIIDEPHVFADTPYFLNLEDEFQKLQVYQCPIVLYFTIEYKWLMDNLLNPEFAQAYRMRYNRELNNLRENLIAWTDHVQSELKKLELNTQIRQHKPKKSE